MLHEVDAKYLAIPPPNPPHGIFSVPGKLALEPKPSNRYKSVKKGEVALQ